MLDTGVHATVEDLARAKALAPSYVSRVLRLTLLAPEIVEAILDGTQQVALTAERLKRASELPLLWDQQRAMLGVDELEGGDLRPAVGSRVAKLEGGALASQRTGRLINQRSGHSAAHALVGGSNPAKPTTQSPTFTKLPGALSLGTFRPAPCATRISTAVTWRRSSTAKSTTTDENETARRPRLRRSGGLCGLGRLSARLRRTRRPRTCRRYADQVPRQLVALHETVRARPPGTPKRSDA